MCIISGPVKSVSDSSTNFKKQFNNHFIYKMFRDSLRRKNLDIQMPLVY